jgi:hypothetical protein
VLKAQGDLDNALIALRESVEGLRELAAKDASPLVWRRALSASLNEIGVVLRIQGDLSGAVAAHHESLDIVQDLAIKDPSNARWQMDVFYSLDGLASAGDDPRGRWGEALAILARLKSQGTLPPSQQGWIGKINSALAALPDANLAPSTTTGKLAALEQIDGTYDGINEDNQSNGKAQFSLTFQQSGNAVTATYKSSLGGQGRGSGTINGNAIYMMSIQSETPNCPGSYIASLKFEGDAVSWTYTGQDCNGPAQGHGSAKKAKS